MKENKEPIEVEVVDEKTEKPKENVFKKFWNKTKDTVNNAVTDTKIEMKFKDENETFTLYEKDTPLSSVLNGYYKEDGIVVYGEKEISPYSVVINDETEKSYYTKDTTLEEIKIVLDGIEYTKPGTFIKLDENTEEVQVIKAGKKYFIYKGN